MRIHPHSLFLYCEVYRFVWTMDLLRLKDNNTGFSVPSDFCDSGPSVFVRCCNAFQCIQEVRFGRLRYCQTFRLPITPAARSRNTSSPQSQAVNRVTQRVSHLHLFTNTESSFLPCVFLYNLRTICTAGTLWLQCLSMQDRRPKAEGRCRRLAVRN